MKNVLLIILIIPYIATSQSFTLKYNDHFELLGSWKTYDKGTEIHVSRTAADSSYINLTFLKNVFRSSMELTDTISTFQDSVITANARFQIMRNKFPKGRSFGHGSWFYSWGTPFYDFYFYNITSSRMELIVTKDSYDHEGGITTMNYVLYKQ